MATDFTQESLLGFLRCNGGRVKNAELLGHFKYFLKEDENRVQNRERFKTFVNAVAVVKHEDGVSYVVLRKKFKVPGGDIGSAHIPKRQEEKLENSRSRHRDRSPRWATSRSRERRVPGETSSNLKTNKAAQVPTSVASESSVEILPVAGIIINNNNNAETVNFEKTAKMSPPQTWESSPPSIIITEGNRTLKPLLTPPFSSESKRSSGSGQSFEQAWDKEPVETTNLEHNSVDISNLGQSREPDGCSTILVTSTSSTQSDLRIYSLEDLRQSPELRHFQQGTRDRNLGSQPAPWPHHPSLYNPPGIYSSSPCIADITSTPLTKAGHQMSSSNDCLVSPRREPLDHVHRESVHIRDAAAINSPLQRRSLPLDPSYMPDDAAAAPAAAFSPENSYHTPLSSTHDCLPESDCKWPFPLTQESWSSDDSLHQRVMEAPGDQLREMLQRAHDAKLLTLLHRPEREVAPGYHRSTGYLDQESPRSRAGSPGSVPDHLRRAPSRHVSQHQRNRISRSLGTGLDQPFPDDNEVARQNRLLLLSSSLSINYPLAATPEMSSSRDLSLSGASSTASLSPCSHDRAFVQRSSLIPLEPKEHEWMVKAASGDWPVIYSLFREDASLLFQKDFISGYTVLHWIAKHGDHRVLNTLWYGVSKTGMKLEVDARTNSGYTPLHLAAMYGHKKLIRLLVHKFKADVRLRDTSGRRAWQYLGKDATKEVLDMLGAPPKKRGAASPPKTHVDSPSERPATISATVKRHSSLAALFKHKSLGRIAGHTEMSV